jgi:outer membrane protein insertion porin family
MISKHRSQRIYLTFVSLICCTLYSSVHATTPTSNQSITHDEHEVPAPTSHTTVAQKIIRKIQCVGNSMVPSSVIMSRLPFKEGQPFEVSTTQSVIKSLYKDLKRFRFIEIQAENIGTNQIDLFIIVQEKTPIKQIVFKGNKKLSEKEIKKNIEFEDFPAADEEELKIYAIKIKKLYISKNYHNADVKSELIIDIEGKGTAQFSIKEGPKAMVKRVNFIGNKHISSKELRSKIFTREDWALSFLDNAGSYQPEHIEGDRHLIEQYYQSNGYMVAKVVNTDVKFNKEWGHFDVTFEIQEGELYTVEEVKAPGLGILKDDYLAARLPIKPGDLYSRENIVESMKALEFLWGDLGYIYAHIDPSITQNDDKKTVKITFDTELGNKVTLNKINISGNKKTKDKVIRRKLLLSEGRLLTNNALEASKGRVEGLGYFDPKDGVTWRKVRIDDTHADLDLVLKEVATGHANVKVGFGGSAGNINSNASGFSLAAEVSESNLMGSGIQTTLNASLAKEEQDIMFNITDPWLFDKPILGAFDVYHRRQSYDDFQQTRPVNERLTGVGFSLGVVTPALWETQIMSRVGVDSITHEEKPIAKVYDVDTQAEKIQANIEYQCILDKSFQPGKFCWLDFNFGQDFRNHPMLPSRGYRWLAVAHFAIPTFYCNVGFSKFNIDASWYTPIIGEHDLVLKLHGYLGIVTEFKGHTIPYRELYHIGGPASVRGFLFGQAGPRFLGDSIGGRKAFFVSAELQFPITPDFNMRGVAFYDGGTGWNNPYVCACNTSQKFVEYNFFNYRHAVGVGIRLMRPMPVRLDWGFKLDRNKKLNETAYEVAFSTSYDF